MCDGLFLIEDTARHNGFEPDLAEIHEHLLSCEECTEDDVTEWGDDLDPAAEIPYWPTDQELADYGHA